MAGARLVVVGDTNQALYRFRGADCHAFERIAEMLSASKKTMKRLQLPINYRCDQAIIQHAQQWVPNLQGNSKALGTVDEINYFAAINRVNNDGVDISLPDGVDGAERSLPLPGKYTSFAFLCRINLPLVITAYQLISKGKRCCIIGRKQIGAPLKNIIEAICGTDPTSLGYTDRISDKTDNSGDVIEEGLITRLNNYCNIQSGKLAGEGNEKKLEALQQNVECIEVIAQRVLDNSVDTVLKEIDSLFVEDEKREPGVIYLSTVHRAKGLEWDVVFILRPDLMPHPLAEPNDDGSWSDEQQQEQNCQYVAWTRARHRAYAVTDWPFGKNKPKFTTPQPEKQQPHFSLRPMEISEEADRQLTEILEAPSKSKLIPRQIPTKQVESQPVVDNGEPF